VKKTEHKDDSPFLLDLEVCCGGKSHVYPIAVRDDQVSFREIIEHAIDYYQSGHSRDQPPINHSIDEVKVIYYDDELTLDDSPAKSGMPLGASVIVCFELFKLQLIVPGKDGPHFYPISLFTAQTTISSIFDHCLDLYGHNTDAALPAIRVVPGLEVFFTYNDRLIDPEGTPQRLAIKNGADIAIHFHLFNINLTFKTEAQVFSYTVKIFDIDSTFSDVWEFAATEEATEPNSRKPRLPAAAKAKLVFQHHDNRYGLFDTLSAAGITGPCEIVVVSSDLITKEDAEKKERLKSTRNSESQKQKIALSFEKIAAEKTRNKAAAKENEEQRRKLAREQEDIQKQAVAFKESVSESKRELSDDKAALKKEKRKFDKYSQLFAEAKAAFEKEKSTLMDRERKLGDGTAKLKKEKTKLDEDRRRLSDEKAALNKDKSVLVKRIREVDDRADKLGKANTRLDDDTRRLTDEKTMFESENSAQADREKQLVKRAARHEKWEKELHSEKQLLADARAEIKSEKADLVDRKKQMNEERKSIEDSRSDIEKKNKSFASDFQSLQQRLETELGEERHSIAQERESVKQDIQKLSMEKKKFGKEKSVVEVEKTELDKRENKMGKERENLHDALANLEVDKREFVHNVQALQQRLETELEEERREIANERENVRQIVEKSKVEQEQIGEAKQTLVGKTALLDKEKALFLVHQKEMGEKQRLLKDSIARLEKERQVLISDMSDAQHDPDKVADVKLSQIARERESVENGVKALAKEAERIEEEKLLFAEQKALIEKEKTLLVERQKEMDNKRRSLDKSIGDLEKQNKANVQNAETLQQNLGKEVAEKRQQLTKEFDGFKSDIAELEKEKADIREEKNSLAELRAEIEKEKALLLEGQANIHQERESLQDSIAKFENGKNAFNSKTKILQLKVKTELRKKRQDIAQESERAKRDAADTEAVLREKNQRRLNDLFAQPQKSNKQKSQGIEKNITQKKLSVHDLLISSKRSQESSEGDDVLFVFPRNSISELEGKRTDAATVLGASPVRGSESITIPNESAKELVTSALELIKKKRFDVAEAYLTHVIKSNPEYSDAYPNLGYCIYQISGESGFKKAVSLIKEGIKRDPESYVPYLYLGRIYKKQNQNDFAELHFVKALELNVMCNEAKEEIKKLHKR
jgi:hypothetical protein